MPKTAPRISFGLFALETKLDSTPSASGLQAFSKIDDLKRDNASAYPFATFEPNFWVLDGGYKFLPTDTTSVHVGMMTTAMSGVAGAFATAPVLTVNFASAHNTDGLVVRFSPHTGDFASSFKAAYYNASNALIREDTYTPTVPEFTISQAVTGFKKLILTFYGTNNPYRYLRVVGVDFGNLIYFEDTDILSASVVEDVDPLSGQARYDVATVTLISTDAAFSIINPDSYASYLQQRQPLSIYEKVDDAQVFIGQFYLDKWKNKSDAEIEFTCVDLVGILDGITHRGGMYSSVAFQTMIANILDPIYIPYEIDLDLYNIPISGWLPSASYRASLQQIALAAGAYIDCSRSSMIRFRKTQLLAGSTDYSAYIAQDDQGAEQSLSLKALVTGVQVTAHSYIPTATNFQVHNASLAIGQYEITWAVPLHDLSVSGASIIESGVNYAILNVTVQGTVTLSGQTYTDATRVVSVNGTVGTLVKPNVMKVTTATLVNTANVTTVAQRIYDYYQQRYIQELKLYAPAVQIGDVVVIEALYGKQIRGVVEKMALDLTGGFTAKVTITGVPHDVS